jgi:hypothetical protein
VYESVILSLTLCFGPLNASVFIVVFVRHHPRELLQLQLLIFSSLASGFCQLLILLSLLVKQKVFEFVLLFNENESGIFELLKHVMNRSFDLGFHLLRLQRDYSNG